MKLIEPGFFKRNKKLFIIALLLFLIPAIISAIGGYLTAGNSLNEMSNYIGSLPANSNINESTFFISSPYLFFHNLSVDILAVVGGLLFSVISVALTIFNAIIIAPPFGSDFQYAAVTILPHGIFEYAATILALTAAFILTKLEIAVIKSRKFRETIEENKVMLKDFAIMVIAMVVLLAIAAIIEGNVTGMITRWYFGI